MPRCTKNIISTHFTLHVLTEIETTSIMLFYRVLFGRKGNGRRTPYCGLTSLRQHSHLVQSTQCHVWAGLTVDTHCLGLSLSTSHCHTSCFHVIPMVTSLCRTTHSSDTPLSQVSPSMSTIHTQVSTKCHSVNSHTVYSAKTHIFPYQSDGHSFLQNHNLRYFPVHLNHF